MRERSEYFLRRGFPVHSFVFAVAFLMLQPAFSFARGGFVSTQGKEIVGPDGKPLLLKGINLGNWLEPEGYMFEFKQANSPRLIYEVFDELVGPENAEEFWNAYRNNYITRKDIDFIKSTGLNSVRVPFDYRLFVRDGDPIAWDSTGFTMLDSVVTWCREAGLWVILDMHCAPGGQTGDNIDDSYGFPFLFESKKSQELTVKLWQKIAERYRNETTVIGYDLLNEPIAPYFDVDKLNPMLEPLYKKITAAIRLVDKNHLIILGGAQWDSNFNVFGKPFDSKLVYTFHKYWSDTTQSVIQEYIDFRNKYDVPVWLGESGENKYGWIDSFRRLLEKNDIGWCFWPYKKLDAPSCIASIKITKEYESIMKFADADRSTFEKIRKNRPELAILEKAMLDYLSDCRLSNCTINEGYLEALGLKLK
ncbi:MAG: glycoside hydrolase family 5 protein [Bacteroidetes bacterium]|nr:glycoside hydrolase family 5 protein [Bacteroidota bacterium]